jgi:hypothetical protein
MVAHLWHHDAMPRTRVSTTVDHELLALARKLGVGSTDAAVFDAALRALLAGHRAAVTDAAYAAAYANHPFDEPDEWGDLASFTDAAGAT